MCVLVRDFVIPSSTPCYTPQGKKRRAAGKVPEANADEREDESSRERDDSSEDSEDNESDEPASPRRRRGPAARRTQRPLSETEAESEANEESPAWTPKRVCISRETELQAITSLTLTPGEAVEILFKQLIQEACSFSIPEDFDDEEEQEAFCERAGAGVAPTERISRCRVDAMGATERFAGVEEYARGGGRYH